MMLDLDEPFRTIWKNRDAFVEVEALSGELFREVKSRRTFRFEINGCGFFLKHHLGVGWAEILKNLLQFKRPILGAANEYHALARLHELDIPTMTCCAFGERGWNPAKRESFLITEELTDTVNLEDFTASWQNGSVDIPFKRMMIRKLAETSRKLHFNGINHRDYYLCHFLLKQHPTPAPENDPDFYLIDLHRAQIRTSVPYHYWVKDLAGLWFSAMDRQLTKRDLLRFIVQYEQKPLRWILSERGKFYRDVDRTARKLYRKEFGKKSPSPELF